MSKVTLDSLDKRTKKLEKGLDEVLTLLKEKNKPCSANSSIDMAVIDIKTGKNSGDVIDIQPSTTTDKFGNVYTILPAIYVAKVKDSIHVSLVEFAGSVRIEPQQISTYKNSIGTDGLIHSIVGVAPNFNQLSMNKSDKFFNVVEAEQLNWKTLFAYQLLVLASSKGKEMLDLRDCEKYNWDEKRDTPLKDTSDDNLLLGIERLVTAGYTFFKTDISDNEEELFALFCALNNKDNPYEDSTDRHFYGTVGDFDSCGKTPLLDLGWFGGFVYSWGGDRSARLCKPFDRGC